MRLKYFLTLCLLLNIDVYSGHGDEDEQYPGLPNWYERAALTLTNACRMAPEAYRDMFLGNYRILLPANYPAVKPLYWNIDLNRAARDHSRDMAVNCGLQHNSCDGTKTEVRIRSFYQEGRGWGENIAYYHFSPQLTLYQWLMDGNRQGVPAPDNQKPNNTWPSGDGHRANIMNPGFTELGVGYATGTVNANRTRPAIPYWTQDFGSGKAVFAGHPIPIGSHLFLGNVENNPFNSDSTTFAVNYYSEAGQPPVMANVVVEGKPHPLGIWLGKSGSGTYSVSLPKTGRCRAYHFEFGAVAAGKIWRYPENGELLTFGEGDCKSDYTSQVAGLEFKIDSPSQNSIRTGTMRFTNGRIEIISQGDTFKKTIESGIYMLDGRLRSAIRTP